MQRTLIWDWPTRLFHWSLAASFALAWLTAESDVWLPVHVFSGYLMLGLLGFRLIWGVLGSHYSRFANFWFGPLKALAYLQQLASHQATRHVGHNPAGSLAIYGLLFLTLVVCALGILILGGEEQRGLAAGWLTFSQGKLAKQLHEAGATLMLLLVGVSIVSRHALGPHLDGLAILNVQGFPIQSQWHLVWPKGKRLSPIAEVFRGHLMDEAAGWMQSR